MNDNDNRNSGESTGRDPKTGRFLPGNRGRVPGTKNRATKVAEKMFADEAENISRVCIEAALAGDMGALKLAIERIIPRLRESPIVADLPELDGDVPGAIAGVWRAVADGTLTPSEGERLSRLVGNYIRAVEIQDLEQRIAALEHRTPLQKRVGGMTDAELVARVKKITEKFDADRKEGSS
jgi:hypothetical protein